jgi:C_GCAxxG_C_C family probable redox protein
LGLKDYLGIDDKDAIIPRIATGLAGGVGKSGTSHCGMLFGTVMALGIKYGREDAKNRESVLKTYEKVQQFWDRFEKEFGSRDCATITGYNLGDAEQMKKWVGSGGREKCTALIEKAMQIAYEYLG